MERVVVCTSSSGLDNYKKPDNIRLLRLVINIDGKQYQDGVDINYKGMSQFMLENPDSILDTSAPSDAAVIQFFEDLYAEGYREVFVVCISSWMSATYETLHRVKSSFAGRLFIHIFDSKTIAYSEALLALEASKMIYAGKSTLEIADRLHTMRENNSFWFVLDDMSNLVKSGKVSAPSGFVAKLFDVKPILQINEEGMTVPVGKVRNINRAIKKMCDLALDAKNQKPGYIFLINTGHDILLDKVKHELEKRGVTDLPVYPTASVSIANHGPHGVGFGIFHDC